MERVNWKDLLERFGVLALVASIVFVGFQLRQDRLLAAAQVFVESDASAFELSGLISEHRDVWLRGLKEEELSDVDEIAFRAIAYAVYRRHNGIYQRVGLLGTGSPDDRARQYALYLYQYPSLRRVFLEEARIDQTRHRFYNTKPADDFDGEVMNILVELDEEAPEFIDKTYMPY